MALNLTLAAVVIIGCVILNKISSRLGIPMLLAFIALGMLFGSDGLFKIPFDDYGFAGQICTVALVFIMFYGGFGTKWSSAKPVAVQSVLLSTAGVMVTAGLTGLFCRLVLKMSILEGMLVGSVISSTDAASVFSVLRSKRLNLKYNTASMLEMESGSNDPFSYMLTAVLLSVMQGKGGADGVFYLVFSQIVYGLAVGAAIAAAAVFVMRRFTFATSGFDAAFMVAVAVLSYAVPALIGGNGYLSAYIVGIVLGNSSLKSTRPLVHFFDGLTGLTQMLIFFLLGLLSFPSKLPSVLLPALGIALFLTFVARPAAVFAILSPFHCRLNQKLLVSFTGLRGAASIVFAMMAVTSSMAFEQDIYHIVFCVVLLSIGIQGTLIPLVSRKLSMIDSRANVLKTFTDYEEEEEVQLICLSVTEKSPWKNKKIRDLGFPPDVLAILIKRGNEKMIPKGNTQLCENDLVVLSAPMVGEEISVRMAELKVESDSKWKGKTVAEVCDCPDQLIMMIRRRGRSIIPNGNTRIREDDVLVIHYPEAHQQVSCFLEK